jgi:hypothetical protein
LTIRINFDFVKLDAFTPYAAIPGKTGRAIGFRPSLRS